MDPGLARERTELAWTRTAISFAAVGGVVLRSHPEAGFTILAMSMVVFLLSRAARPTWRFRSHERRRPLMLVSAATITVALAALVITFLGHAGHPVMG